MFKFLLRVVLVAAALALVLPKIAGVSFHGDWIGALVTSLVFNAAFIGLEWLLGVIVFGINIGTLGLGVFVTNGLRFVAGLLTPSLALVGTSKLMPSFVTVSGFFPSGLTAGLVLGGLLWASLPDKKRK